MSLKRLEPLQCLFCFVFVVYSFIFLLLSFLNSFCECFFLFVWEWFFFADPLVSLISLSLVCNNKLMVCFFCFVFSYCLCFRYFFSSHVAVLFLRGGLKRCYKSCSRRVLKFHEFEWKSLKKSVGENNAVLDCCSRCNAFGAILKFILKSGLNSLRTLLWW